MNVWLPPVSFCISRGLCKCKIYFSCILYLFELVRIFLEKLEVLGPEMCRTCVQFWCNKKRHCPEAPPCPFTLISVSLYFLTILCFFFSDRPVVQFPADHPKNLTLAEGATATFSCKTIGNPPTTVQKWQFNGVDIRGESCSGCTTITFQKGPVSQLDAGWYSCIGTNSLGDGPPASAQLLIKRK